MSCSALWRLY